jgi:hypothetical protein
MTGLKQRIPRRRAPGSPRRSVTGFVSRLKAGLSRLRPGGRTRMPWGKRAERQPALAAGDAAATTAVTTTTVSETEVVETAGTASFRDRGRLRRRLRFLRRARELAFRDVGGLIFDMRRFGRDRPDLVEAKLAALGAVDRELRALERVLDDRRPIHELHEPGLSSCPRCGALHASEDNFCPRCGLQFGGAQAMGEVGGAIAAPPQAPQAPDARTASPTPVAPGLGAARPAKAPGPGSVRPLPATAPPADARATTGSDAAAAPVDGGGAPSDGDGTAAPEDQPTEIHRPPDGS